MWPFQHRRGHSSIVEKLEELRFDHDTYSGDSTYGSSEAKTFVRMRAGTIDESHQGERSSQILLLLHSEWASREQYTTSAFCERQASTEST